MIFTIPDYFSLLCKLNESNDDTIERLEYIFSKYYLEAISFYHIVKSIYSDGYIDDIEYIHNKKMTSLKISLKIKRGVKISNILEEIEKSIQNNYKYKLEHNKRNIYLLLKRKK